MNDLITAHTTKTRRKTKLTSKEAKILKARDEHEEKLINFARGLAKDSSIQAEDVVQLVWLNLLNKPKGEDYLSKACLFKNAKWRFGDLQRKEKNYVEYEDGKFEYAVPAFSQPQDELDLFGAESDEDRLKQKFWETYASIDLTDQQKTIVWMKARDGYTFKEIQEITGVRRSTASGWMSHCRKQFISERKRNPHMFSGVPEKGAERACKYSTTPDNEILEIVKGFFNKHEYWFWLSLQLLCTGVGIYMGS